MSKRERIEPDFIANRTFKGTVMKLFLEEEGIKNALKSSKLVTYLNGLEGIEETKK